MGACDGCLERRRADSGASGGSWGRHLNAALHPLQLTCGQSTPGVDPQTCTRHRVAGAAWFRPYVAAHHLSIESAACRNFMAAQTVLEFCGHTACGPERSDVDRQLHCHGNSFLGRPVTVDYGGFTRHGPPLIIGLSGFRRGMFATDGEETRNRARVRAGGRRSTANHEDTTALQGDHAE